MCCGIPCNRESHRHIASARSAAREALDPHLPGAKSLSHLEVLVVFVPRQPAYCSDDAISALHVVVCS